MSSKAAIATIKKEIDALRRQDGSLAAEDVVEWIGGGLEVQRAGPVERRVETDEGERVAVDVLVRARRT